MRNGRRGREREGNKKKGKFLFATALAKESKKDRERERECVCVPRQTTFGEACATVLASSLHWSMFLIVSACASAAVAVPGHAGPISQDRRPWALDTAHG